MLEPRKELQAHKLQGKLDGKWSCSLNYDLRMVYEIDDVKKEIIVVAVGSHKEVYD
jgi:mRNA interferase YafQ